MRPDIHWARIGRAVEFFRSSGYSYIEVPWAVPLEVAQITLPSDRVPFLTQDGVLVGSAEQSLMQLALEESLPSGKYVAVSPCFRDEVEDEVHHRHFMKVELMVVHEFPLSEHGFQVSEFEVLSVARKFMHGEARKDPVILQTPEGLDLELGGLEVGSYGYRKKGKVSWTYGTGLAEPRFSQALAKL